MTSIQIDLVMSEWQKIGPYPLTPQLLALLSPHERNPGVAALLGERLRLTPGFSGLEIASTSYVGRVEVGPLKITVVPKIATTTLARMLKYAYGIDDLWNSDLPTSVAMDQQGLQDTVAEMLLREVERIWRSGLPKVYLPTVERLSSIRGRVEINALARMGVLTEPRIACRYFGRTSDWHLNRVLRSGLLLACRVCQRPELVRSLQALAQTLEEAALLPRLSFEDVSRARMGLTRGTDSAQASLNLIDLLLEGSGLSLRGPQEIRAHAFLFDMNMFFQRFLSRFLREYAHGIKVVDEESIRNVYKLVAPESTNRKRRPPKPRPDFAVSDASGLRMYLDAKYRDLWMTSLPAEWLYQLSAYSLASPTRASVLLYPTTAAAAQDELIEVCDPITGKVLGSVGLRPVAIDTLGELAGSLNFDSRKRCTEIAMRLLKPTCDIGVASDALNHAH